MKTLRRWRYEIGDELLRRIRREDRYSATLEPALAMLPSYTQLGMAALLPQQTLALADNDSGEVLADGQEVVLKLEEQHPGTTHYKDYKSVRYLMRRSFTSDFDF